MTALPALSKGNGVPEPNPRLHWVETVDANAKIAFQVWSPAIWELWTHYNGKTKPCFEDHTLCEGGHDEETMRWYGYVFGWHHGRNGPSFLQLTTGAARSWFSQIATGCSLRGMLVTVQRGKSKRGPLHLKVDRYQSFGEERMGQDMDPQHSVFRLWKVSHLGHAFKLSLVSGPQDLSDEVDDTGCLKTPPGALSFKGPSGASSRKSRSRKPKQKPKPA